MGEMSYILFPYYQYIAEVIYMFFSLFLFKFFTQVGCFFRLWWKLFSKKNQNSTEHVKSFHIVTHLILSFHLLSRSFWGRLFLWWALWRCRLLLWFHSYDALYFHMIGISGTYVYNVFYIVKIEWKTCIWTCLFIKGLLLTRTLKIKN